MIRFLVILCLAVTGCTDYERVKAKNLVICQSLAQLSSGGTLEKCETTTEVCFVYSGGISCFKKGESK